MMFRHVLLYSVTLFGMLAFPGYVRAQDGFQNLISEIENRRSSSGQKEDSRFDVMPWKGSVLYSKGDLSAVYSAILDYERRQQDIAAAASDPTYSSRGRIDSIGGLDGINGTPNPADTPAQLPADAAAPVAATVIQTFYVNSILYESKDNWTLWLNGARYRPDSPQDGFKILRVKKDQTSLLWQTASLDSIMPNWREGFESLPSEAQARFDSEMTAFETKLLQDYEAYFTEENRDQFIRTKEREFLGTLEKNWRATLSATDKFLVPTNEQLAAWAASWEQRGKFDAEREWEKLAITQKEGVKTLVNNKRNELLSEIKRAELLAFTRGEYNWNHKTKDGSIYVNSFTGAVMVNLGMHQTFVSQQMAILEGNQTAFAAAVTTPIDPATAQAVSPVVPPVQ